MTIAASPGKTMAAAPSDVAVRAGGARYTARCRLQAGVLHVRLILEVKTSRQSCAEAEYAAMRPALDAAVRDRRVRVTLVPANVQKAMR